MSRPYGGSFNHRKIIKSRYLILSGSISFQTVQEYLAEFFNPTHNEGAIIVETYASMHHICPNIRTDDVEGNN